MYEPSAQEAVTRAVGRDIDCCFQSKVVWCCRQQGSEYSQEESWQKKNYSSW